jgi:hypothetical protein
MDLYEVSNLGRVRSLDRVYTQLYPNGKEQLRHIKGSILKFETNNTGYLAIQLYDRGKRKRYLVHRLVAEAFIPNPNNLPEVNHKDECKTNNRADNLEWCNGKYNSNFGTGKWRKSYGRRKIVEQLTLDGQHVAYYSGAREAGRLTGFRQGNISAVCRGENPQSYGYKWKYVE